MVFLLCMCTGSPFSSPGAMFESFSILSPYSRSVWPFSVWPPEGALPCRRRSLITAGWPWHCTYTWYLPRVRHGVAQVTAAGAFGSQERRGSHTVAVFWHHGQTGGGARQRHLWFNRLGPYLSATFPLDLNAIRGELPCIHTKDWIKRKYIQLI